MFSRHNYITKTFQNSKLCIVLLWILLSLIIPIPISKFQDFDGDYHGSEAFVLKGSDELAMETWQPSVRHRKSWTLEPGSLVSEVSWGLRCFWQVCEECSSGKWKSGFPGAARLWLCVRNLPFLDCWLIMPYHRPRPKIEGSRPSIAFQIAADGKPTWWICDARGATRYAVAVVKIWSRQFVRRLDTTLYSARSCYVLLVCSKCLER